jgi:predicted metal-dependent peptidase
MAKKTTQAKNTSSSSSAAPGKKPRASTKSDKEQNSNNQKMGLPFSVAHEPDPSIPAEAYSLDNELLMLLWQDPFYGVGLSMLPRKEDWSVETAYIGISKETKSPIIGYNPDFMRQLTPLQKRNILKHEFLHWVFKHITDRAVADRTRAPLHNVAADLAINSILCAEAENALPDFTMLPGRAPKTDDAGLAELIKNFPKMESTDWYMSELENYLEKNGKRDSEGNFILQVGDNGMTLDSHEGWDDIPEELRDVLRNKAGQALDAALRAAQTRGWGTVPAQMQQWLLEMTSGKADWRSVLRNFLGRAKAVKKHPSMKRINKRMPYIYPGSVRDTTARILWAVDQSGSVTDENIQKGMAEAQKFSKIVDADMVNFDTEIDLASKQVIKNGKLKWERTRCGGTDFNCVARFMNDPKNRGKWTGVIIVTDGYAPVLERIPGVRVLWLLTPEASMDAVRTGDLVIQMDKDKTARRK